MNYYRYDVRIRCEDWFKMYGAENTRGIVRGIMIGCGEDVIFTQIEKHDDGRIDLYVPVYCTEATIERFIEMIAKYFPKDVRCSRVF